MTIFHVHSQISLVSGTQLTLVAFFAPDNLGCCLITTQPQMKKIVMISSKKVKWNISRNFHDSLYAYNVSYMLKYKNIKLNVVNFKCKTFKSWDFQGHFVFELPLFAKPTVKSSPKCFKSLLSAYKFLTEDHFCNLPNNLIILQLLLYPWILQDRSFLPCANSGLHPALNCTTVSQKSIVTSKPSAKENKGIGDAGSTADFRMLWSGIVCFGLL